MVRDAGHGPKALACRHNDHGGTTYILNFPTHTSGATTKGGKEGGDAEDSDCMSIPFSQEIEDGVELGCKSSEDVFFCLWVDGWGHYRP